MESGQEFDGRQAAAGLVGPPLTAELRTKVYDDMFSWQGVCGVYQADGFEQYLVLGNFAANEGPESSTNLVHCWANWQFCSSSFFLCCHACCAAVIASGVFWVGQASSRPHSVNH